MVPTVRAAMGWITKSGGRVRPSHGKDINPLRPPSPLLIGVSTGHWQWSERVSAY